MNEPQRFPEYEGNTQPTEKPINMRQKKQINPQTKQAFIIITHIPITGGHCGTAWSGVNARLNSPSLMVIQQVAIGTGLTRMHRAVISWRWHIWSWG